MASNYAFQGSPYAQHTSGGGGGRGYDTYGARGAPHNDRDRDLPSPSSDDNPAIAEKSAARGAGAVYGGERNGVWRREDKRAFAQRSTAVKIFRSIGCVVFFTIAIIITFVCGVIIFARPPNVGISEARLPTVNDFSVSGSSFLLNSSITFAVSNPNTFSATLQKLEAHVYDSVDLSTDIGSGSISNQKIEAGKNTTIVFPYAIKIDPSKDQKVLQDLLTKCASNTKIDMQLKIDARLSVLSVAIPVPITRDLSLDCPLPASALQAAGGVGDAITSILGGARKRSWSENAATVEEVSKGMGLLFHATRDALMKLPGTVEEMWEVKRREAL